jgi:photosystem II stability/assembly factor-like uncharacterized protein
VICVAAAGLAAVSVAYLQPFAARSGSGPFLLLRMVTPQFVSATTGWVLVEQVESAPARVTHDTVFATTDAGRTWRRLSLPVATARPVEINLVNPADGFVAATTVSGSPAPTLLFATSDFGRHWQERAFPPSGGYVAAIQMFSAQRGVFDFWQSPVLGLQPLFLYTTDDGGGSWVPIPQIHIPAGEVKRWVWFSDATTGWAFTSSLYMTHDAARTWARALLPAAPGNAQLGAVGAPASLLPPVFLGDGAEGLMSAPLGTGGAELVYSTHDAGRTWEEPRLVTAPGPTVVYVGPTVWLAYGRHSVSISADAGLTWTANLASLPAGDALGEIQLVDVQHLWATDPGSGGISPELLLRSTDGGAHWTEVRLPAWT